MKKIIILLALFLFSNNIISQGRQSNILILPQGFPIGELNGLGSSGLLNKASNIRFMNPAALNNFKDISFGVSYEFQSELKEAWIAGIGFKRDANFIPQSAGFIYPTGNFRVGLSMAQGYNGGINIGPIAITTPQNPNGTGEFTTVIEKRILYNYSMLVSYSFDNIIDGGKLSIGGRFDINKMTISDNRPSPIEMSFAGNSWTAGAAFTKYYEDNKYFQVGLYYENNATLDLKETTGPDLAVQQIGDYQRPPGNYIVYPIKAEFPSKLKLDIDISAIPGIKFLGSIQEVFWNDIESPNSNITEFSGSVVYKFNDMISSSIGLLTSQKKYNDIDKYFHTDENLAAIFLTLGSEINVSNLVIDISLADSHLFSGDWRKQTIGKIGAGYGF